MIIPNGTYIIFLANPNSKISVLFCKQNKHFLQKHKNKLKKGSLHKKEISSYSFKRQLINY